MIAYNICYSTFVNDQDEEFASKIKDSQCHVIEWDEEDGSQHYRYRFLKQPEGVIPSLLKTLLNKRKEVKKLMKNADSEFLRDLYDKKQLSYKISSNSTYGFLGVSQGYLPFKIGAATTTTLGRHNIQKAARHFEKKYNAKIVYGDSVSPESVIYIECGGKIQIHTIESFYLQFRRHSRDYPQFKKDDKTLQHVKKEQVSFENVSSLPCFKTLTHTGQFETIRKIIRHKTPKKMYRIFTTAGVVTCTADHSLLLKSQNASGSPSRSSNSSSSSSSSSSR